MRVLIITYYWPPGSGPGVQRWLKFCKYLPSEQWDPTVITVRNGSYPNTDPSLEADVPADMRVVKTETFEPFALYNLLRGKKGSSVEVALGSIKGKTSLFARLANYIRANFFIPDARLGWNRYSMIAAMREIKSNKPDVIITTGPPHSTHLVGQKLHALFGIPWVADFRDPWTSIYYNAFLNRTERSKKRDLALESSVLQQADLILCATPGMKLEYEGRAKRVEVLPNGFDEEDFESLESAPAVPLTLAYVGNLKANQPCRALWQALHRLKEEEGFHTRFRVSITGNVHETILREIHQQGLEHMVEIQPFVPHKAAITSMLSAHILLLPVPESAGNELILTGKIFEYLACRRPILSFGPTNGNAAQILEVCGKEPMLDYTDVAGVETFLKEEMKRYNNEPTPRVTGNLDYQRFSRRGTTKTLAELLNSISPA